MSSIVWKLLFWISVLLGLLTPLLLSSHITPGQGLDEIAHIHRVLSAIEGKESTQRLEEGLSVPGVAPYGQGHQGPLFYWFNKTLLGPFVEASDFLPLVDYRAGVQYSSEGGLMGGTSHCAYRLDQTRSNDPNVANVRNWIGVLRGINVLLFVGTILLAAYLGSLIDPKSWAFPALLAAVTASIPTALSRSIFVNNDSLVCFLAALVFVVSVNWLASDAKRYFLWSLILGVLSALCYLSKYNGLVSLGIACAALALHHQSLLRQKVGSIVLCVIVFGLVVAPDAYENFLFDGDVFSSEFVGKEFPLLTSSTSLFSAGSSLALYGRLIETFWVNFFSASSSYSAYLEKVFYFWWTLVVAGLAGVSLYVVSPKTLSVEKRCTMLAVLSIAGAFVATVLFATRFSVADGRYLHVVLLPFCFILAIGLMALLKRIFPKHWEQSALLAFLGMLVLGHLITWGYQGYRLIPCASATKHNVDAGVEILPIDLTGDRVDEIVMYHRARTRAFVYRWQDGVFKLIPRWTRVAGAAADLMYAKDVKLNGKEDLLFYRPSNERLSVVQAKEFSCPDCSLPLEGDSETMISEMNKALPEIKRWYEGQSERMEIGFSQLKQISPDLAKLIENEREHLQVIEASLSSEKAWLVFNKSTAQLTVVNCSATLPESPSCEIKSQGLWRP